MLFLLLSLLAPAVVLAGPCVEFDTNFNLYVFGLNGKDVNLGAQSTWSSPNPQAIATSGRPPFDGTNTMCFLSQYNNAIYVLGADNANPANIYIYDATDNLWTMSVVTTAGVDPSNLVTILDHDTNEFYGLSGGNLYSLDFGAITNKATGPTSWAAVEAIPFQSSGYKPVIAIAQNHMYFLDVPGNSAGQANIFVIHYSYFQPEVQSYPGANGSQAFPETHGQVTSFFDPTNQVQQQFAFIPDDNSATYIVNVENNSTITLAGPTDTTASTFTASPSALVQLTSAGSVYYTAFDLNNPSAAATWTHISGFGTATTGNSTGSSSASASQSGSASKTGSGSGSATASGSGSSASPSATHSGTAGLKVSGQSILALGAVALAACFFL